MKKKAYLEPTTQVVKLQQRQCLLAGSDVGGSMPDEWEEHNI
jgi:hypothetical protein